MGVMTGRFLMAAATLGVGAALERVSNPWYFESRLRSILVL